MKNILALLLLFPLLALQDGNKYLEKIAAYQKESYYKTKVYAEHDWKSFSKLKDAQSIINPDNFDLHLLNAAVFYATNKMRESKGQKALKFGPELRNASVLHCNEMIEKNFFDHMNNRTPKLHTPDDRFKIFGITSEQNGENIDEDNIEMPSKATYWQVAELVVKDMYDSPPHRKIMLNKGFTRLGASCMFETKNRNGFRYFRATQDFAGDY